MGYHRAGFEVVGVDIKPQPNYPFRFLEDDALGVLENYAVGEWRPFVDAIHASPPCQSYSKVLRHLSNPTEMLVDDVRDKLVGIGLPWVIENVPGAPLPMQDTLDGRYGTVLCGTMFGLKVYRHRLFETSFPVTVSQSCNHSVPALNPYNAKARKRDGIVIDRAGHHARAMEVEWMKGENEIGEAIPPAYTELIGTQLLAYLQKEEA
jgi:DNA (cytosine-5)-methyltransferase 1